MDRNFGSTFLSSNTRYCTLILYEGQLLLIYCWFMEKRSLKVPLQVCCLGENPKGSSLFVDVC